MIEPTEDERSHARFLMREHFRKGTEGYPPHGESEDAACAIGLAANRDKVLKADLETLGAVQNLATMRTELDAAHQLLREATADHSEKAPEVLVQWWQNWASRIRPLLNGERPRRERNRRHHDHKPCALRILGEFYSPEDAHGIAMNFTCFPMDCDIASKQAVEFLANRKPRDSEVDDG